MILIYMNSGEWGGLDIFVMRFAEYLKRVDRDFFIVENLGSRLRLDLTWAKFLTVDEYNSSLLTFTHAFFPSISKLVEKRSLAPGISQATLFTWIVQHNDALYHFFPVSQRIVSRFGFGAAISLLRILPKYRRRIETILDAMIRHGALATMDGSTLRSLRFFYPTVKPASIMVPLPVPQGKYFDYAPPSGDILSIGYLGRMDYFKFSAIGPFIRTELARIAKTRSVMLVAITVGTHVEQLQSLCAETGIILRLHGFMPNDQARETLARETHFAVAMGTAALDIAASGHPCIFIDPAERVTTSPQTRFRFVHEAQEYMVGEFRDFSGYVGGIRSLEESIAMVLSDTSIGKRDREYVHDHHDPDRINATMLRHIDASTLTVAGIRPALAALTKANARDLARVGKFRRFQGLLNLRGRSRG